MPSCRPHCEQVPQHLVDPVRHSGSVVSSSELVPSQIASHRAPARGRRPRAHTTRTRRRGVRVGARRRMRDRGARGGCIVTSVTKFPIQKGSRDAGYAERGSILLKFPDREGCSSSERLVRYETWNVNQHFGNDNMR
jgi:hypothetical protein